jgi:hypothetical protein
MVIVCCFVFFHPGSAGDRLLAMALPGAVPAAVDPAGAWVTTLVAAALWTYLVLLPVARLGLTYNLHAKKALPGVLQPMLEGYTNLFGMIVWRVFSADHTNFVIRLYEVPADGGPRRLISHWTNWWQFFARYNQVAEAITVTTLFTTLKYYPSNTGIFTERVLRYARTVPRAPGSRLVFEHVSVMKRPDRFDLVPAAEFTVDLEAGTIDEVTLDPTRSVRAPIANSPVHEGARPGSYVPLKP